MDDKRIGVDFQQDIVRLVFATTSRLATVPTQHDVQQVLVGLLL
jgi:hypothetical protein